MAKENIAEENIKFQESPPPGTLGLPELFAIALGYVIGAGIVTYVGPALEMTGRSAWIAYLVAILLGLIINLPAIFITSTVRMGGGPYSMLAAIAGKKVAGIYSVVFLALLIQMALFGTAIGTYINALWPQIPVKWAGIAVLTLFYIPNLFGVDVMAKLQKSMTWILIAAFLFFIFTGIPKMDYSVVNFGNPEFITNGIAGFIAAVFLFINSTNGYLMTMSYGKNSKNAQRDIPKAILMCVPTFIVLYCGVAIVYGGTMPLEGVGATTLVGVAMKTLNPVLFVLFMIGGPFMAITSTMNSAMANNTIPIAQSCKDGWFPKSLADENKHGVSYKIMTIIYLFGVIPLLFDLKITELAMIVNLALASHSFLYTIAYWKMPKMYSEKWKQSKFHIPIVLYRVIVILAFLGWGAVFLYSLQSVSIPILILALGLFIFAIIYGIVRSKDSNIKIEVSVWTD